MGALIALGVACWFAGRDAQSSAARGVVAAMLLCNVAARCASGMTGVGLWPAVVVRAGLGVWCVACLNGLRAGTSKA